MSRISSRVTVLVFAAISCFAVGSDGVDRPSPRLIERQDEFITVDLGGTEFTFRRVVPCRYEIDYEPYFVAETEVTNEQYAAFLNATGRQKHDERVLHAVRPTADLVAAATVQSGLGDILSEKKRVEKRLGEVTQGSALHGAFSDKWWALQSQVEEVKAEYPILHRGTELTMSSSDPIFRIHDVEMLWHGNEFPRGRGRHPVTLLTPADAMAFCEWVEGLIPDVGCCRLPTDDEWAVAAYGDRDFPWGQVWDDTKAHVSAGRENVWRVDDESAWDFSNVMHRRTVAVDALPEGRTPEGLFGMAGNVAEMTFVKLDNCWGCTSWMGFDFTDGSVRDRDTYTSAVDRTYDPRQTYFGGAHSPHCRMDTLGFRPVIDPERRKVSLSRDIFPASFEVSEEYRRRIADYEAWLKERSRKPR
ncbi:MAG: SUMF1/EgtB/PvdO family nonheme iron enzyme [Planctomycetota bacterium]